MQSGLRVDEAAAGGDGEAMTDDDDCGCKCQPCRFDDVHTCDRRECLYTAYRRRREKAQSEAEAQRPKRAAESVQFLRGELAVKFGKVQDPESRKRLFEWARFLEETAGLERELREAKRRERMAEMFG